MKNKLIQFINNLKEIIRRKIIRLRMGRFYLGVFYDSKKYCEFEVRTQIEFLLRRMHDEDYSDIIGFKEKDTK